MKQVAIFLLFVFAIVGLYGFAFSMNTGDDPGQKVFVDKKCGACHTVTSAGLTSKNAKAVDLSTVGASKKADFFEKYLNKKEKVDGKEHKTAFKGTDQELKDLTKWLESLKK
ncbi:MAG TPA: cytochrome c [Ignavibacteriaceae bacterium]|nr:cytochrome c [Ignavibacteriaceae bacterium]